MSATATRPALRSVGPGLRALAVFVVVATVALAAALVTGATGVFNVLVFVLFAVLWLCFAAALVSSPTRLDEFWRAFRRRSVAVQALGWLLFLPLAAALLIWEHRWHVGVRLVLVLGIALVNLFMFFPRGQRKDLLLPDPVREVLTREQKRFAIEHAFMAALPISERSAGIALDYLDSIPGINEVPFERITVPTLIVQASDDPRELAGAEEMVRRIPDSHLLTLSGGHFLLGHEPEIQAATADFIAAHKHSDAREAR